MVRWSRAREGSLQIPKRRPHPMGKPCISRRIGQHFEVTRAWSRVWRDASIESRTYQGASIFRSREHESLTELRVV